MSAYFTPFCTAKRVLPPFKVTKISYYDIVAGMRKEYALDVKRFGPE